MTNGAFGECDKCYLTRVTEALRSLSESVRHYVDQPHVNGAVMKDHLRPLVKAAEAALVGSTNANNS